MSEYRVLVTASGKYGTAFLPYVICNCESAEIAAERAKNMAQGAYPEYAIFESRILEVTLNER